MLKSSLTAGNINPLTDFLRNSKAHITRLKETQQPEFLTVHGKTEVVVQDADSYNELLRRVEHAELLQSLRTAMTDMDAGKGIPFEDAKKELDARFGV